jgi:hypothetical protein
MPREEIGARSGSGIAEGYHRKSEETAEAFAERMSQTS